MAESWWACSAEEFARRLPVEQARMAQSNVNTTVYPAQHETMPRPRSADDFAPVPVSRRAALGFAS